MRAAAVRICFTGRTRRRASERAQADPDSKKRRQQQGRPPDLSPHRREGRALGLLDEELPADRPDGRPGAQHPLSAEVAADRRAALRRGECSGHLGKSQGSIRESGAVRVRDGYASGVDRVDVSGRPETSLPNKVLNDSEIECLANDSGSCCGSFLSGEPTTRSVPLTTTSIDLAPGLDKSRGAYTGPK